jgi:hypothetical protein
MDDKREKSPSNIPLNSQHKEKEHPTSNLSPRKTEPVKSEKKSKQKNSKPNKESSSKKRGSKKGNEQTVGVNPSNRSPEATRKKGIPNELIFF